MRNELEFEADTSDPVRPLVGRGRGPGREVGRDGGRIDVSTSTSIIGLEEDATAGEDHEGVFLGTTLGAIKPDFGLGLARGAGEAEFADGVGDPAIEASYASAAAAKGGVSRSLVRISHPLLTQSGVIDIVQNELIRVRVLLERLSRFPTYYSQLTPLDTRFCLPPLLFAFITTASASD
jgi:hypothetical protein